MKNTPFALLAIFSLHTWFAVAQDSICTDCPPVTVARYDLEVALTPDETQEMGWTEKQRSELYMVSPGLFNTLFENSSADSCLLFTEGKDGTERTAKLDTTAIKATGFAPSLLSVEEDKGIHYALSGIIEKKSKNRIEIRAWIVVPASGEKLYEWKSEYDPSLPGYANGALLAQQAVSLGKGIREMGKKARDDARGVAIGFGPDTARQVNVSLDKEKLNVNQSAAVNVRIMDCDGRSLQGIQLELAATGGQISPEKAVTDAGGQAQVRYTAPCETGEYRLNIRIRYDRPFDPGQKKDGPSQELSVVKEVRVDPAKQFTLHYEQSAAQQSDAGFDIVSSGKGVIVCTIDEVNDSLKVSGTGMVVINWTSPVDPCMYSGRNTYRVAYSGLLVDGGDGSRWLECSKTGQLEMGGNFNIDCSGEVQELKGNYPIPDHETGRQLRIKLVNDATDLYEDPDNGSKYKYTVETICK